jgi:hypothetical protein
MQQLLLNNLRSSIKRIRTNITHEERLKLIKSQNIMRHLGMHTLMINMMRKVYYRPTDHGALFDAIIDFLLFFCYYNKSNQNSLLPRLNFLLSLHEKDIDSPALIAEILKPQRGTAFGHEFLKFIIDRITQK